MDTQAIGALVLDIREIVRELGGNLDVGKQRQRALMALIEREAPDITATGQAVMLDAQLSLEAASSQQRESTVGPTYCEPFGDEDGVALDTIVN